MKVVINKCFGGFGLSKQAQEQFAKCKNIDLGEYYENAGRYENIVDYDIARDDVDLVNIVETLGKDASSWCSQLVVIEIPDGVDWYVEDYDGLEHIAERHRIWR